MPRRDYYVVLGVKRNATADEIKRAFRALALQYHPDRNPDDVDAERRFREAVEAYQALSDAEQRARYDRLGPLYRPDGRPPTPEDFNTFVSQTLASLFGRRGGTERGEDLRYTLAVTLEQVGAGAERAVTVLRKVKCKRCDGSGADPDEGRRDCSHCEGSGRSPTRRLFRSDCPHCDGRGYVTVKRCSRCDGDGRHELRDELVVRVPPGVATGQKLKLRDKGNETGDSAPTGDLYVLINVEDHPLFLRRGEDLLADVPVMLHELALGAELAVPTLEGSTTVRIPAGTPSGKIFRLTGRGLPSLDGKRRGDLHIRVNVEVPADLDTRQRAVLDELSRRLAAGAYPMRRAYDAHLRGRSPG